MFKVNNRNTRTRRKEKEKEKKTEISRFSWHFKVNTKTHISTLRSFYTGMCIQNGKNIFRSQSTLGFCPAFFFYCV